MPRTSAAKPNNLLGGAVGIAPEPASTGPVFNSKARWAPSKDCRTRAYTVISKQGVFWILRWICPIHVGYTTWEQWEQETPPTREEQDAAIDTMYARHLEWCDQHKPQEWEVGCTVNCQHPSH